MRRFVLALVALGSVGLAASVHAQCAFQAPGSAKKMELALVPAFQGCEPSTFFARICTGTTTQCTSHDQCGLGYCKDEATDEPVGACNGTTQDGYPFAVSPPITAADTELQGSPVSAFRFGPKGRGTLKLESRKEGPPTEPVPGLNPPGDTRDVGISVAMKGVVSELEPNGVNGLATLIVLIRFTFDDRVNGDLTYDDGIAIPVQFTNGTAKTKSSADVSLNQSKHGLPPCTVAEIRSIRILDSGSRPFARPGLFMP